MTKIINNNKDIKIINISEIRSIQRINNETETKKGHLKDTKNNKKPKKHQPKQTYKGNMNNPITRPKTQHTYHKTKHQNHK